MVEHQAEDALVASNEHWERYARVVEPLEKVMVVPGRRNQSALRTMLSGSAKEHIGVRAKGGVACAVMASGATNWALQRRTEREFNLAVWA